MKELSLNVLDVTENSVKAGATLTEIGITETDTELIISIKDNGCGMSEEVVQSVTDPFYTTRTTRRVGLGIPLFKLAAEMTGGRLEIESKAKEQFPEGHGTTVTAYFFKTHIDFTPLGDIVSTITTLIQGHADVDFIFTHTWGESCVSLDTRDLRAMLDDVPLDTYEVIKWIEGYLIEQYDNFFKK